MNTIILISYEFVSRLINSAAWVALDLRSALFLEKSLFDAIPTSYERGAHDYGDPKDLLH